jgi:hypothetical protein
MREILESQIKTMWKNKDKNFSRFIIRPCRWEENGGKCFSHQSILWTIRGRFGKYSSVSHIFWDVTLYCFEQRQSCLTLVKIYHKLRAMFESVNDQ